MIALLVAISSNGFVANTKTVFGVVTEAIESWRKGAEPVRQPRLAIVSPSGKERKWDRGSGKVLTPPLALPLIAGLTPPGIDVLLFDGNEAAIDIDAIADWADWVAITYMTASARRAQYIGDALRAKRKRIPVIVGGIHPSVVPDDAAEHADAVVVGEAEPVWETVIEDLQAGNLQPRYYSGTSYDLVGQPRARRDLLKTDRYQTVNVVQTARGCPHGCLFCSVGGIFGRRCRFRPVSEVIDELRSLGDGWVGFVDDNITVNLSRAMELFEAMIPLKLRWVSQGDLGMAEHPELLRLAKLSGCQAMYIGLESVSDANLQATKKSPNIGLDMPGAIRKIHKAGIEIIGSFVLGLDGDDPSVFKRTSAFARKNKLVAAQFSVLTPYPGTAVHEQLEAEGRIFERDWSYYTMSDVVFRPKGMTVDELREGQHETYRSFYSLMSIAERNLIRPNRLDRLGLRLIINWAYRRMDQHKGLPKWLP